MSYTIRARVSQSDNDKWFNVVEKTVWYASNGGTWTESNGEHTLTMGGSGTSGTLRFQNPENEYFLVAMGFYDGSRWCDIVPDLKPANTGVEIHPTYYNGGSRSNVPPQKKSEASVKTEKGADIKVKLVEEGPHKFSATITVNYS